MVIIRINGIFYIVTPSYMLQLSLFEPSSGSNKEGQAWERSFFVTSMMSNCHCEFLQGFTIYRLPIHKNTIGTVLLEMLSWSWLVLTDARFFTIFI